jgi:hypothetical protein
MREKPLRSPARPAFSPALKDATSAIIQGANHMKTTFAVLGVAALCLQMFAAPVRAEMSDDEKAAAAIAILGIAALAHHKHHYKSGYAPNGGQETADFETCYRDGLQGYDYVEGSRDCAEGWQAGNAERENSRAHRAVATADRAPPMALQGCAQIVAQNFAVGTQSVHFIKSRSPSKHEWEIEAAVGHQHMVCKVRDSGELIDLRGGNL